MSIIWLLGNNWRTLLVMGLRPLIETSRDISFLRVILKPQSCFLSMQTLFRMRQYDWGFWFFNIGRNITEESILNILWQRSVSSSKQVSLACPLVAMVFSYCIVFYSLLPLSAKGEEANLCHLFCRSNKQTTETSGRHHEHDERSCCCPLLLTPPLPAQKNWIREVLASSSI